MSSDPTPTVLLDPAVADLPAGVRSDGEPGEPQVTADAGRSDGGPVVLEPAVLDVARSAAAEEAGGADQIGEFLLAVAEDDVAVTATFSARQAGYQGWHWSVTVAVLAGQRPTVSEVVLLPGDGALLAPPWIPWDERIRPGDLGISDLLPPIADDPRVVPAYVLSDDPAIEEVARELGIGRVRVLSREGRVDFAERLHDGTFGPTSDVALGAPAQCVTCAFYLPLAGSLSQLVGACGNEFSPADGRVVDAGYGCGAHSETVIDMPARSASALAVIDELSLEVHRRPVQTPPADPAGPSSTDEPADHLPADVEPADHLPADVEPVDHLPADVEPAEHSPADVEPAEDEPADDQLAVQQSPEASGTSSDIEG